MSDTFIKAHDEEVLRKERAKHQKTVDAIRKLLDSMFPAGETVPKMPWEKTPEPSQAELARLESNILESLSGGVTLSCGAIAKLVNMSAGTVSKQLYILVRAGRVDVSGTHRSKKYSRPIAAKKLDEMVRGVEGNQADHD